MYRFFLGKIVREKRKVDENFVKNNQSFGRIIRQSIWIPDIRQICRIPVIWPDIRPDIWLNSYHIIFFSINLYYQQNFFIFLIAISLLYSNLISTNLFLLLFLIQNSFSGRISGKLNRISGLIPDIKKSRIPVQP